MCARGLAAAVLVAVVSSSSCTGVDPAPQSEFVLARTIDSGHVEVVVVECGTARRLAGVGASVDGRASTLSSPESLDRGVTRYFTTEPLNGGQDPEARVLVELGPDYDGPNFEVDAPARPGRFGSFGTNFSSWQAARAGCPY